jgi:hypothetical protein
MLPFATGAYNEYGNLTNLARTTAGQTPTQQTMYSNLLPAYNQTQNQFGDWSGLMRQQALIPTDPYSGVPYLTSAQQQLGGALNTSQLMAEDAAAKAFGNTKNTGAGTQEFIKALYQPTYNYETAIAGLEAQKAGAQQTGMANQTAAQRAAAQLATQLTPMSALIPGISTANTEQTANIQNLLAQSGIFAQGSPYASLASQTIDANTPMNNALSKLLGGGATGPLAQLLGGGKAGGGLTGALSSLLGLGGSLPGTGPALGSQAYNAWNYFSGQGPGQESLDNTGGNQANYAAMNQLEAALGLPEGSLNTLYSGTNIDSYSNVDPNSWGLGTDNSGIDWSNFDWNNLDYSSQ